MANLPALLPRTGIDRIDNAATRAPRTLTGYRLVKDPTGSKADNLPYGRWILKPTHSSEHYRNAFEEIDDAYMTDSYVRQGVDKYVELILKQDWKLHCESIAPIKYIQRRLMIMSEMTGRCFDLLIADLVHDFVAYGNAFWVKKRDLPPEGYPGLPRQGAGGEALPILGYFRADPKRMSPRWSKDGTRLLGWELEERGGGNKKQFRVADVVHFPFSPKPGCIWGCPSLIPVLEDVRAYRRCEEYVIRLLYKHLNPLMHHEVPDLALTGQGRQEDVDQALRAHSLIAPDGMIITPPNHKITMIGAESRALRGEAYIKQLRERIYAGLVVNPVVMGESAGTSQGTADAMTANMHNRAKFYQRQLAEMLTEYVLYELAMEGGFDPIRPAETIEWIWNEIETETLLQRENHLLQLWLNGLLTQEETRREIGWKPLEAARQKEAYIHLNKIPLIKAQAEAAAARAISGATGGARQSDNRARPRNQHGTRSAPKVRPK